MIARAFPVATTLLLLACASDVAAPAWYPIDLHARAGDLELPGVAIEIDGRPLGVTDGRGVFATVLEGTEGTRVLVGVHCPDGYLSPEAPTALALRRIARPGHPDELRAVSVTVECRVERRDVVVVVSTHGVGGVPVALDGRTVATTDALGFAHVPLSARPGESVRVHLDTSSTPELLPRSPALSFVVPDQDEVVVFDRPLAPAEAPARHRSRRRDSTPDAPSDRRLPVRLLRST